MSMGTFLSSMLTAQTQTSSPLKLIQPRVTLTRQLRSHRPLLCLVWVRSAPCIDGVEMGGDGRKSKLPTRNPMIAHRSEGGSCIRLRTACCVDLETWKSIERISSTTQSMVTFSDVMKRVRRWLWAEFFFNALENIMPISKLPHRFLDIILDAFAAAA